MSGPITRQYGVPNWDEIFGKKENTDEAKEESASKTDKPSDSLSNDAVHPPADETK